MKECTDQDIEDVLAVVAKHTDGGIGYVFLREIFLHSLQHQSVKILMPDENSMCLFVHIGDGEYDMHTIGDSPKTFSAMKWMLDNHDGCNIVSWYPPNKALERVCRLFDKRYGSVKDKTGKHYLRKDMICHL